MAANIENPDIVSHSCSGVRFLLRKKYEESLCLFMSTGLLAKAIATIAGMDLKYCEKSVTPPLAPARNAESLWRECCLPRA